MEEWTSLLPIRRPTTPRATNDGGEPEYRRARLAQSAGLRRLRSCALLLGESEPDLRARSTRRVHLVAEAQVQRPAQPLLRVHERSRAGRPHLLLRRHEDSGSGDRDLIRLRGAE